MSVDSIRIVGAREHNLRSVTVVLPRQRLIVITGLSGSGKSSLAFDTLYAEGQRRYVESLSAHARVFLERLPKPDVDRIEGLSPAVALEPRTGSSNPRSTVATVTELYDYLRIVFAYLGQPHCPRCRHPLRAQSPHQIVEELLTLPAGSRLMILAPMDAKAFASTAAALAEARRRGYVRVRLDGVVIDLDTLTEDGRDGGCRVEIVVDRLTLGPGIRPRLADSVELGLREGSGVVAVSVEPPEGPREERHYTEIPACLMCGVRVGPLTPRSFSFNSPEGACRGCAGLGERWEFDETLVVPDPDLSLEQGAIRPWRLGGRQLVLYYRRVLRAVARHWGIDLSRPYRELGVTAHRILMRGSGSEPVEFGYWRGGAWRRYRRPFEGVLANLARRYAATQSEAVRQSLRRFMSRQPCPECGGKRLRPEVLACTLADRSIADVCGLSVADALAFLDRLNLPESSRRKVAEPLEAIRSRLHWLAEMGLDYLTLDRQSGTLSGGEFQRLHLASQLGAGLTGVLYVLDEPTVGLHPRDVDRLVRMLQALRDQGNTVVVVEHDEQMIRAADYVVDLGPGAGRHGGEVVAAGPLEEVLRSERSLTAQYLTGRASVPIPRERRRASGGVVLIEGASEHNLKNVDVAIPLGLMVCVTGVSGSGKSTLVDDILRKALFRKLYGASETPGRHRGLRGAERIRRVMVVDQTLPGRTPRSNPATYTGAMTALRALLAATPLARARGYGPGRFSFNVKGGRCEVCKGEGVLRLDMQFLPDVYVTCEACSGRRYHAETLDIRYRGRNIAELLEMTVDEALEFFAAIPGVTRPLKTLSEVGLGYLPLGQSATTLSGGEAQRVKLSAELSRLHGEPTLYLLDEPTRGLHAADISRLLEVLLRLRDGGHTVVVVEHHLDVIKTADYIIDLGPEGGDRGGWVVATGTPEEVARSEGSYTGRYLRKVLS